MHHLHTNWVWALGHPDDDSVPRKVWPLFCKSFARGVQGERDVSNPTTWQPHCDARVWRCGVAALDMGALYEHATGFWGSLQHQHTPMLASTLLPLWFPSPHCAEAFCSSQCLCAVWEIKPQGFQQKWRKSCVRLAG
eukprot:scaffold308891_cov23-Tisochrysis_lutea.AAC.1